MVSLLMVSEGTSDALIVTFCNICFCQKPGFIHKTKTTKFITN